MNDEQWIETMEAQALAASDSFDIGATADPDAILAANAKHHVLWLIGRLRAAQDEAAKWRLSADMLAGHHAVPLEAVERAEREARRIVERTTWNMALEGQRPDDASIEKIVKTVTLELLKDG